MWVDKCLSSLISSTFVPHIIIVDNASQDDTVKIIKENYPSVDCIKSISNLGFGAANNIGIKKAMAENADFVFLLNQDAWVEKSCIEILINQFEESNEFHLLSPFHFNHNNSGLEFYFKEYVLKHYTPGYTTKLYEETAVSNTTFVHAAAWMLPVETLQKIGGFDPLFNHTGEDNDFVQRLLYKKMKVGIVKDASVYHKGTNQNLIDAASNYTFLLNTALLKLKNPSAKIGGAFLLFFKNFVKVVFEEDKRNTDVKKIKKKVYLNIFKKSFKIIASRKEQKTEMAYLK